MTRSPVPHPGAPVTLSAWSVHVPGLDALDGVPLGPACAAEDAATLVGRKGLLYKDPATRLALCAVHRALGLPAGAARSSGPADPETGVVAASNLGNVATVAKLARTVQESGGRAVSPMDAPNASSNVVAATVSRWFRFGGPSFMVASGATAGLDAVALGARLLRSGRARRVVVVGAEPDDDVAQALAAGRRLRAGAACVVLEGGARPSPTPWVRVSAPTPEPPEADAVDLAALVGDSYGAAGVIHLAVAAGLLARARSPRTTTVTVVVGDAGDGWRSAEVGAETTTTARPAP